MSVECTNPNHKSAQTAQLGQPAPNFELDLYIPQTQQSKIKNNFVIRRQKGINCELQEKKLVARHLVHILLVKCPACEDILLFRVPNLKWFRDPCYNYIVYNTTIIQLLTKLSWFSRFTKNAKSIFISYNITKFIHPDQSNRVDERK